MAALGAYRMAVVVAGSAVEVLAERDPQLDKGRRVRPSGWHSTNPCPRLEDLTSSQQLQLVVEVLDAAAQLVTPQVDSVARMWQLPPTMV